ncbi:amino acid adenylation domain-containing protein [Paenibacillus sp. MER TA 81-3]|uniref:non-ribosomal peptide synthetase n=1 Tax=Paenibacillus sp. MER TA 81-3 TaxID=2939573 RepID=UPI0020403D1C|nr:non-ribosomal peptide synthetase [Paenibacillus sp. MER TA 81-3]MCM3340705.1 amino acid adenylation domain-containing protein [Paenibacillus sp. MER TA 81-3]
MHKIEEQKTITGYSIQKTSHFPFDLNIKKNEFAYINHNKILTPELVDVLNKLTNNSNDSLLIALSAAIAYLLHRYTDDNNIQLGLELDRVFIPVHCDIEESITFKQLILNLRDIYVKKTTIHEDSYDTVVSLANNEETVHKKGEYKHQLMFQFIKTDDNIHLISEYNSNHYSNEYIVNITNNLISFLQHVVLNYDEKLMNLEIVSQQEQENISNQEMASFDKEMTINRLFEKQVTRNGNRTAVVFENEKLSFEELNTKATELANSLYLKGIKNGDIVGIMLNRSLDMIVSVLGVLKIGATYLPIDPNFPNERVNYMLVDSKAKLIITNQHYNEKINFSIERLLIEECKNVVLSDIPLGCIDHSKAESLAYIIYTSGTTGNPKGVQITHRNVVSLLFNDRNRFDFNNQDVWTMFHSFSFDFSVWEMFGALLYGGRLVIVPDNIVRDPVEFAYLLEREKVTVLNQTPTFFYSLINHGLPDTKLDLCVRCVIFGGEALNPILIKPFKDMYPNVELINMYGITETTIHVTYKKLDDETITNNISNIGRPISTLQVYVLNKNNKLCPINTIGELYVAGEGVSRGYLNRPELTEERFISNPFKPGQLMYKTGDLVRRMPNGEIIYVGRSDEQVKVRGYRIEVGEIEKAIVRYESIREAVVTLKEYQTGDKVLYCYYVSKEEVKKELITQFLQKILPSYMIPSLFERIVEMPITNNGKIDRKKLASLLIPEQSFDTDSNDWIKDEITKKLVLIWKDVLKLEHILPQTGFFDSGGDSIRVIRLVALINKTFTCKISTKDIYKHQTIQQLSVFVREKIEVNYPEEACIHEISSEQKRDILAGNNIAFENVVDIYPMSNIQQSMVYYSLLKPNEPIYHDQFTFPIEVVDFNFKVFKQVMEELANKHEILKTTFITEEQFQLVHHNISPIITYDDLSSMDETKQELIINAFLKQDLEEGYSFDKLLWRVKVFQLSKDKVCIIFSCHHAILDGWSIASLYTELLNCYSNVIDGRELRQNKLKSSYRDYVLSNLSYKNQRELESFWLEYMNNYTRNKLPFNYTNKQISHKNGRLITSIPLGTDLYDKLVEFCSNHDCTIQELCLGAYLYLLHVIGSEKDIVTGIVTHNRPAIEDGEKILGCFLNTIPIRVQIDKDLDKLNFLKVVKNHIKSIKSNELFLADISTLVGESGNGQYNPIFDTLFNYMDFHVMDGLRNSNLIRSANIGLNLIRNEMTNTLFDFEVLKTPEYFGFQIKYAPAYFKSDDISQATVLYERILKELIHSKREIFNQELLVSEFEKEELLFEKNDTDYPYEKSLTLHQLFEKQALENPNNVAIICNQKEITYHELNLHSNRLARFMLNYGVNIGDNIGVCLERSIDLIGTLLAILKIGATYVPLEPDYPKTRKCDIIENANIKYVISNEDFKNAGTIKFNDFELSLFDSHNLDLQIDSHQLAYIIYTSGSTGRPKGVMIEHHSVVNLIYWVNRTFNINEKDVMLFITSICFDLSVYDIFGILSVGGKIVMSTKEESNDLALLKNMIMEYQITFWDSTPSTLNQIIQLFEDNSSLVHKQHSLRLVFLSGDWIPVKLPTKINNFFPKAEVVCLGGATEATIWSNFHIVDFSKEYFTSIPYGKPIDNTYFYILDDNQEIVPKGVCGELYIGGVGISRGYNGEQIKTKNAFFPNHLIGKGMIYKTGDKGRYLPSGEIEFLGRIDHQVKIRGYRVELGEIESKLFKYPGLKEVVIVDKIDITGEKYLCAYYSHEEDISSELFQYLSEQLPRYMIPSFFIKLNKLPLTINGKIDRSNLPEPSISQSQHRELRKIIAPVTAVQDRLIRIWKEIIKIDHIGIDDNFFELGGHSLTATRLVSKIHKEFHLELAVREVFTNPTILELSHIIDNEHKSIFKSIPKTENKKAYRLSSSQHRMYVLHHLNSDQLVYNMPNIMMIEGDLDTSYFCEVFQRLVDKHEILRTSFHIEDGAIYQKVNDNVQFEVPYSEILGCSTDQLMKNFVRPFRLDEAPLLRMEIVKVDEKKHLLLFDIHHIISDGISSNILIKDIMDIYESKNLPDNGVQYKDYAEFQQNLLDNNELTLSEEFWLKELNSELPRLNLPIDYTRPNVQEFIGDRVVCEIGSDLYTSIVDLAKKYNSTVYLVLLSTLNVLLSKYTGQEDIIVGSPVSGRRHADVSEMVGLFVNTIVLRNYPEANKSFADFLTNVTKRAMTAFDNQEYPFELIVEKVEKERDITRNPIFDVMLTLQNQQFEKLHFGDLSVSSVDFNRGTCVCDISINVSELKSGAQISFEFVSALFRKETIERMLGHFINILNAVTINPLQTIQDTNILSTAETEFLYNNSIKMVEKTEFEEIETVISVFEEKSRTLNKKVAIVSGERSITYEELNNKAEQIAHSLRERGVSKNKVVAIILEKSIDFVTGILGVLKAGGAYLPIDPEQPVDRIKYMIDDSASIVTLSSSSISKELGISENLVNIEDIRCDELLRTTSIELHQDDLAYIIYTSGTTGRPKGVLVKHEGIMNLITYFKNKLELKGESERFGQIFSFSFDAAVLDIYLSLTTGTTIYLMKKDIINSPSLMANYINENKISIMHLPPTYLTYMDPEKIKTLSKVVVGSSKLNKDLVDKWAGKVKLVNAYGPTESTVITTVWDCNQENQYSEQIPIGEPIPGKKLFIFNHHGQLQPIGIPGEIYIGGIGLALGYLNNEKLTNQKFVNDPSLMAGKLYKTGDLGKWLPDGSIEYLGRIDHQVKIRGYRIELGEIEHILMSNTFIRKTFVTKVIVSGEESICAYIVSRNAITEKTIREYLSKYLPNYMIPSFYVFLSDLPLNKNGKIDIGQLPLPVEKVEFNQNEKMDDLEFTLYEIWGGILGINNFSTNDKFFEIGGNSIGAVRLELELEKRKLKFDNLAIYKYSTIKNLANHIKEKMKV